MSNSLLDYNVFGWRAGKFVAEYAKSSSLARLSLALVAAYENELKKAKVKTDRFAPVLFPLYNLKKDLEAGFD